jgi:hypothetical protein
LLKDFKEGKTSTATSFIGIDLNSIINSYLQLGSGTDVAFDVLSFPEI